MKTKQANIADYVFCKGNVYTVDKERSWAKAVAVKEDIIIYVGDDEGIKDYIGETTKVIDLDGKMLLPGFFDNHCHSSLGAFRVESVGVSLRGYETVEEVQNCIRKFSESNPDLKAIYGYGWRHLLFDEKGPRKELLDTIVDDRPVCLYSECYHAIWANSKAIEMAGITKDTPNPIGGRIEKDDITGEPLGTFRETSKELIAYSIPQFPIDSFKFGLKDHMKVANACGITTACDAWLVPGRNEIEAYRQLDDENELTVRYRGMIRLPEGKAEPAIETMPIVKEEIEKEGNLYKTSMIKIFIDGVVEALTAYVKEPYLNTQGNCGMTMWESDEELKKVICAYAEKGFQIHAHVIGDAAAKVFIDAIKETQKNSKSKDNRHSLVHLEVFDLDDIKAMEEEGIIAVVNSYWHHKYGGGYHERFYEEPLGEKRANAQYPLKSFFSSGLVVANGSDYPISDPCDPLVGMQVGVNKRQAGNPESRALNINEKATLDQMISTYTINAAYLNFMEDITGSIEVGKKADIVILEKNIFDVHVDDLYKTKILLTMLEGKVVYQDSLIQTNKISCSC